MQKIISINLNCYGSVPNCISTILQLHIATHYSLYFNEKNIKIMKRNNWTNTANALQNSINLMTGSFVMGIMKSWRCCQMSDAFAGYGEHSVPPLSLCSLPNRSWSPFSSFTLRLSFLRYIWFTAKCREQCTCGHKRREYKTPYKIPWPPKCGREPRMER